MEMEKRLRDLRMLCQASKLTFLHSLACELLLISCLPSSGPRAMVGAEPP